MDELITFLRACYDRERVVAEAALWDGAERWQVLPGQEQPFHRPWQVVDDREYGVAQTGIGGAADPEDLARHIAYWDPARVLAEVAAKRLRLEEIERMLGDDPTDGTAQWLAQVEAAPYAGQPGWRDEWKV